jgi:hypothetical protein
MKDNVHLRDCHSHLGQLMGHLENRAKDRAKDMQRQRSRVPRPSENGSGG